MKTHSILQRMRELAVQSANDTNDTGDRGALQSEITALISEVGRISTDTEFNGKTLLDGTFSGTAVVESFYKLVQMKIRQSKLISQP